ncbi:hypothetical protein Egran_02673, partial [Elaphomyces granulatus]
IVQLLDSFVHQGPNGQHQCLVFELLGPTVARIIGEYNEANETIEPRVILRMSEQLLEAIEFIHDAGMGHGAVTISSSLVATCPPQRKRTSLNSLGLQYLQKWLALTASRWAKPYRNIW